MRITVVGSGLLFLGLFAISGCSTPEYIKAKKAGDRPWLIVDVISPDAEIPKTRIEILKLVRKAKSRKGKSENLRVDKHWGEGHGEIEFADKEGTILRFNVSWTEDDPNACEFSVNGIHVFERENSEAAMVFDFHKDEYCDIADIKNPFLSGRIQRANGEWVTLDFNYSKADSGAKK